MTKALTVLRVLTTLASGNVRWICSPSESVLETVNDGGIPREKSSGLPRSTMILPGRLSAPA